MKASGYIVIEQAEDFEQVLALDKDDRFPKGGILDWSHGKLVRAVFASAADARNAIIRTEHYRLAFGSNHPEKKFCRVVPVKFFLTELKLP